MSGLSDYTAYTWEVRGENGVDFGPAASIYQAVAPPGGNRRGEPDNIGDDEGEPDTPMAKPVAIAADEPGALAVLAAPNPFNAGTTLRLHLPEAAPVTMTLHRPARSSEPSPTTSTAGTDEDDPPPPASTSTSTGSSPAPSGKLALVR